MRTTSLAVGLSLGVIAWVPLAGCGGGGGSSTPTDGGHPEDGSSTTDGAPHGEGGADAAPIGDGGAGTGDGSTTDGHVGDGGTSAGAPFTGDVTATVIGSGATFMYGVVAEFAPTVASPACPGTMMGGCCFEPALSSDAGAPDGGATADGGGAAPPNAGIIAVTDGAATIATLMPSSAADSGGYGVPASVSMWSAGDTLTVMAPGSTVHPFSGSVKAVSALAGVSPDLSQPLTIGRSTDLVITWTVDAKTTGATVAFAVADVVGNAIACQVPDSAGAATMPAALLGMTSPGSAVVSLTRTLSAVATDDNAAVSIQSSALSFGNASLE
jgi:hypothetical protein